ncbi:LysR family transcriptional regulator [Sphingomonas sp. CGMCC 1.13654]|uniref:LysR family transcriptional regulator n=1 Tax=Sphingomonas chungangi TaxID=2683589 RepID=A0A838L2J3_9SPHN|nr:LysR substrate-binding domain-containing protein [Sphingomonas chungangi]MBA2933150.1 LysR family transcriptional regulator [Sphingomonas chungangi]MVW57822.1 LysR family transcriptional regulator [Sphingomonas chungangi]
MAVNLPTNILRSFVAIADAGSMLQAADHVFVTQSALSLQIRKLEDLLQQSLFHRDGRRLSLTSSGELLLDYARRVLALHDEAVTAIGSRQFVGPVRIGMVQDFAEALLSGVLARFSELHADAQIYARVAGTAELLGMLERDQLDIVVGYAAADAADAVSLAPMAWYGDEALVHRDVLPIAVLEPPCRFREAAISALDAAGRPWRIAIETPNLSSLRAAVDGGLGITCRTSLFSSDPPLRTPSLPGLPAVTSILRSGDGRDRAVQGLLALAHEVVAGTEAAL